MKVYIVEGGIGKHVIFTSLIPELAKNEKIIIMSTYPDIFDNNPFVYRSLSRNSSYQWDDLMMKKDTELFFYEPYYDLNYVKGEKNLIQAWCNGLNIEYKEDLTPQLYLNSNLKEEAIRFKQTTGKFIIIQFTGSQSPLYVNNNYFINNGAIKNYPYEKVLEVIQGIKQKNPELQIVNFALSNESKPIENVITLNTSYLMYAALLEEAESFICIDSSLVHFAGALQKKGIALWGATNPKTLGYDFHINLTNKCKLDNIHCNKPYVRELGDYMGSGQRWKCPDPTCIEISPKVVVENLFNIIEEDKNE